MLLASKMNIYAATVTSTGSGAWAGLNWDNGTGPNSGDNVVITSGHTITITAGVNPNNLTIDGTLDQNGNSLQVSGALGGTGGVLASSGSILILEGNANFSGLTFITDATTDLTFQNAGTITGFPGTDRNLRNLVLSRNSICSFTANNITIAQNLTITNGTYTFNGADLNVNSNLQISGGTLDFNGNIIVVGNDATIGGTLDLNAGNSISINGEFSGNGTLDANSAVVTLNGAINFTGTFTSNSSTNLSISNTGAITSLPTITNLNNFVLNRVGSTISLSGSLRCYGNCTITNGTMDINGRTLQVDGTLSGTGTVDATGNSTLISSSAIDFSTFILNSDQTTSITFQTAGTISNLPALTDLNNLVLNRAGITLTLSGQIGRAHV